MKKECQPDATMKSAIKQTQRKRRPSKDRMKVRINQIKVRINQTSLFLCTEPKPERPWCGKSDVGLTMSLQMYTTV